MSAGKTGRPAAACLSADCKFASVTAMGPSPRRQGWWWPAFALALLRHSIRWQVVLERVVRGLRLFGQVCLCSPADDAEHGEFDAPELLDPMLILVGAQPDDRVVVWVLLGVPAVNSAQFGDRVKRAARTGDKCEQLAVAPLQW